MDQAKLWCAVIEQAFADAIGKADGGMNASVRGAIKAQAATWLTSMGRDFIHVCDLAGVDPVAVSDKARKAIHG